MSDQKPLVSKSQIDRFKEAARHLEADESEAAFDEKLKILVDQKHGGKATKGTHKEKNE